jgi:hypothetical protein
MKIKTIIYSHPRNTKRDEVTRSIGGRRNLEKMRRAKENLYQVDGVQEREKKIGWRHGVSPPTPPPSPPPPSQLHEISNLSIISIILSGGRLSDPKFAYLEPGLPQLGTRNFSGPANQMI